MNFDPPEEARELVELARSFARSDLARTEVEIDRIADPVEAYASEALGAFRKQVRAIGFHQILLPAEIGGLDLSPLTYFLVLEQLTTGGAGLGLVMQADLLGVGMAVRRRTTHPVFEEYVSAFVDDAEGDHSGAWAITEPDVGCDIYSRSASFGVRATPTAGGGGFVINGAKSSWCSNGWLADMLCVMINVDPDAGMDGTGVFLIPASWPGIT
ncbi:MAG: acyl-CoA dehydrogenase family protein [Acidimicrobiia bacterium]